MKVICELPRITYLAFFSVQLAANICSLIKTEMHVVIRVMAPTQDTVPSTENIVCH